MSRHIKYSSTIRCLNIHVYTYVRRHELSRWTKAVEFEMLFNEIKVNWPTKRDDGSCGVGGLARGWNVRRYENSARVNVDTKNKVN